MAVCFFNKDYNNKYICDYEVIEDKFCVTVNYDINDEIEAVNGVKSFGPSTEFDSRDILIIDHDNKCNFLLKAAYYAGSISVYGTPDGGTKTHFKSHYYLKHHEIETLADLPDTPKAKSIRVYSKKLCKYIEHTSIDVVDYKDKRV